MIPDSQTVFVSYASPDRDRVAPYCEFLERCGVEVWIDYKNLKAGQHWDFEIRRALEKAAIVIVFVSNNSMDRRGYVQREIKLVLDKAEEMLTTDIYIIPVILDEAANIQEAIKKYHYVAGWRDNSCSAILDAIQFQLNTIGSNIRTAQERAHTTWTRTPYPEFWDGLPGYQTEFELLNFSSDLYPGVRDVTIFLHGELTALIMRERRVKFEQSQEMSFGQQKFLRTNTLDAHCAEPIFQGSILSVQYSIHYYISGAAHPNMHFKTYAFFLDPVVHIQNLEEVFHDPDAALHVIQSSVREQLLTCVSTDGEETIDLDKEQVEQGTNDWQSFSAFVFQENALELFFAPYQVACYAAGPQSASIDYKSIIKLMRKEYIDALGISHLFWTGYEQV